jgi:3',5'-nucleoside bisphosphate phosphatase
MQRQLISISADLHVHTVLSPCAEVEMIPPLIVRRAQELGLGLIAITDHNTAENCAGVMQAAEGTGLRVLAGMEAQTSEEVHILCLFDELEQALTWQGIVFDHLPDQANPEELLGAQFVVDASGEYIRTETRFLAPSTDLALGETIARVHTLGGLAIPAHIDRPSFSLLANLGFVPADLDVPALEVFRLSDTSALLAQRPYLDHWPLIRGGDAHRLDEMSSAIRFRIEEPTVAEIRAAFTFQGGRTFVI